MASKGIFLTAYVRCVGSRSLRFLAWLACLLTVHPTNAADRPNIVLVMCDDLGWGDVGFNGNETIQTPHLDAMAGESLKFNRFYAAAPVCSPTRGSCLTGRHPFRYGIPFANSGHMKPQELTLAELLRDQGYATGHFGKWHLGTLTKTIKDANRGGPRNLQDYSPPQDNGFEVCFSTESKVPTYDPMLSPKSKNKKNFWNAIEDKTTAVAYGTYYWNQRGEQVTDNLSGDNSRVIMDRVVPFIEDAAASQRPFFAVVWFHTPHLPVVADAEHRALYPEAKEGREQNYFGCITAMDEQIGRLRSTLRRAGVAENTLLTFCSDNGPEGKASDPGSAGPYRGRKRSLYEGGIRVPALIEWPDVISKPSETDFPAVTSDYLPTILDFLGITIDDPRPLDGISLRSVFKGEQTLRHRPICFQSRGQVALSGDRYKLIRPSQNATWEMYDLLDDPSESQDIASSQTELVEAWSRYIRSWQTSCERSDQGADYSLSN